MGDSRVLQGCRAGIHGKQIPHFLVSSSEHHAFSVLRPRDCWRPPYSVPSPVVLNPGVHQNHLQPFVELPPPHPHPRNPTPLCGVGLGVSMVSGCPPSLTAVFFSPE